MRNEVDICVLAHNRCDITLPYLSHLADNTKDVAYRIWCLDNASEDDTPKTLSWFESNCRWWYPWARRRGIRFKWLKSRINLGFSGGNNFLARFGSAPWILFMNNDAFPHDADWLRKLVDLAETGDYDAVGPIADNVLGLQQEKWCHRGWPETHPAKFLSGFCVLVRRSAFEQVNGWDEGFFMGDEDLDLSIRLREVGYQRGRVRNLGIHRGVFVQHLCSMSMEPWCAAQGKSVSKHFEKTREQLLEKHGHEWHRDLFFWEDLRRPPSDWESLGVMNHGQYWNPPGSERKQNESMESVRCLHSGQPEEAQGRNGERASGSAELHAGELHPARLPATDARAEGGPEELHSAEYHTGTGPGGVWIGAAADGSGCPIAGLPEAHCATCGSGVYAEA